MKKEFSSKWVSSSKPRKQRKYRAHAPLHAKQKMVRSHLSKDLSKKYSKKTLGLRKNDKVTVMRGQHKKKSGKVERIDLKKTKVYITGIEGIKKDGTKYAVAFDPSNLLITELSLDDKKRVQKLQGEKKETKAKQKPAPKQTKEKKEQSK